ncbi:hypothetical protein DYB25_012268 [Aphanomyces astaci]|uniref:DDE-1 domain-containing protein n=1 Tax=Aphanomyces astaci TaxID=112090 RepID=A0A397FJ85_APHAT|nr:hypothetical protein DYB25_012268 [Aphanomyces astaci]RHY39210.1 hypothetical protein DYB30_011074 [Aphanomyces astaci]RHZ29658.1 hypothetical protein DYB31_010757 [Aphanomyces astaci]
MLSDLVPSDVARPILLIVDGCSSHYSVHIVKEAKRLNIMLQFLPANSTHLFQPLDVSVFRPFKIADDMWNDIGSNVTKQKAISITCEVWANSTKTSTGVNGFASTGLFPPSLDAMMYRFSLFQPPSERVEQVEETWLERAATIRKSVLLLPPKRNKRGPVRKTLSVNGMFITADYHELLQAQAEDTKSKKRARKQQMIPSLGALEIVVV